MHSTLGAFGRFLDKHSVHSISVLRIFLGLVFLYFGWSSVTNPDVWIRLVPEWTNVFASATLLVRIHGVIEIALGILLIMNIGARYVAFVLFLDLLHVLTLLDFLSSTWMRDFGLAGALLSLALARPTNAIQTTNQNSDRMQSSNLPKV